MVETRRELQPLKLTFTDIAKTVGERWQVLDPEEKEQFEHQAAMAKEQYNTALSKYKRTSPYREYQIYLVDFKARNTPQSITGMLKRPMRMVLAQSQAGTKRPKLETEISGTSSGSGGSSNTLFNDSESRRKESTVSHPAYSPPVSSVASPTVVTRITTRSPDSSVQSSLPNTPINTVTPISNTSHIGPSQKGYEGSSHHLPRILPLDSRDSRPHITSLIADPLPFSNPRRTTTTTTPTAFLRHDTSKSSISSNLSGASTTSTGYTSATPIEEKRSSRSLPPIPSLLHHRSIDNVMISDGDPRAPQAPSPRFGIEFGELTSKQPMGLWTESTR